MEPTSWYLYAGVSDSKTVKYDFTNFYNNLFTYIYYYIVINKLWIPMTKHWMNKNMSQLWNGVKKIEKLWNGLWKKKNREASSIALLKCRVKCANDKVQFFSHNKLQSTKLKYVKNYLRNSIPQDHFESFKLMSVEKHILTSISTDTVIDNVALNNRS